MMDLTFAWFPIAKGITLLILLVTLVVLARKKWYRTAFTLGAVMLALSIYSPVKIDGTNTRLNHKTTHTERTAEYSDVARDAVVVKTEKETFAERMAKEAARSKSENEGIKNEIKSIHSN